MVLLHKKMKTFRTTEPLVVFGATGMLAGELVFMNLAARLSATVVLHSSSKERLQGLKDEIEESGFGNDDLSIITTTDPDEACAYGGRLFFAKSVRASRQSREEMLLHNAPMAAEIGRSIARSPKPFRRVVCVSNPSDLMGLILLIHSGMEPHRVISLSALDTLRLRRSLSRRFGIDESRLGNAFTLGSHDESMAPMLHGLRVGGDSLIELGYGREDFQSLYKEVRKGGINIYHLRGHTAYQSPAILALRMLFADDLEPFELPFARYLHSDRYPHVFGSLPGRIDDRGAFHAKTAIHPLDLRGLNLAFASIAAQRDRLVEEGWLPDPDSWRPELQKKEDLIVTDPEPLC